MASKYDSFADIDQRSCHKLDLRYFTLPNLCPRMVRKKARRTFETFLYLARASLNNHGEPVRPSHEELCLACGLDPIDRNSPAMLSRVLRGLRLDYRLIDFVPRKRCRPEIRVLPAAPESDFLNPRQYVYFREGWTAELRRQFETLGRSAFAAEYMFFAARYEAMRASKLEKRPYWFFPQDKIAETYQVSPKFVGLGLQGLVDLGVMRVNPGQRYRKAKNDEFGRVNRYYFDGLEEIHGRQAALAELRPAYEAEFEMALKLAAQLINGATRKNVVGLCELLRQHGETVVKHVIMAITPLSKANLKRRLSYVATICASTRES